MERVPPRWGEHTAALQLLPSSSWDKGPELTVPLPLRHYSFAGNSDPSFVLPSCIATRGGNASSSSRAPAVPNKPSSLGSGGHLASKRGIDDLDFYIGHEALEHSKTYSVNYPIRHGQIEDWDQMERYWEQCIFKYLRCEPEDHDFLLVSDRSVLL